MITRLNIEIVCEWTKTDATERWKKLDWIIEIEYQVIQILFTLHIHNKWRDKKKRNKNKWVNGCVRVNNLRRHDFSFQIKIKKIKLLSGWTIERKSILTIIPVCLTHGNKFDLWFDKQDLKCLTFFNVQEDSPKKGGEKNYSETICNEFKDRTLSQWNEMKPNLELK